MGTPLISSITKIRPTGFGGTGIQHFGDVRMIHHGQGLPFRFETGHNLAGVHAGLNDFERHLAADRLLLLGHKDHTKAPFANFLEQFVAPDDCTGAFTERSGKCCIGLGQLQKVAIVMVRRQQCLDALAQRNIVAARLV